MTDKEQQNIIEKLTFLANVIKTKANISEEKAEIELLLNQIITDVQALEPEIVDCA